MRAPVDFSNKCTTAELTLIDNGAPMTWRKSFAAFVATNASPTLTVTSVASPRSSIEYTGALICPATPALAHPHIFTDTQIEVIFDETDRAEGLRITWAYDDLTSLQVIADHGMDVDFDGTLTAEETAALSGFDMHWDEGYAGDTYALLGKVPLRLTGPTDWTAS